MPNIAPDQIVGTISRAALEAEIGKNLAHSALARMKKQGEVLIPDFEQIERGDIILSRHCLRNHSAKNAPVVRAQKSLMSKDFCAEACSWGHAMVYIGNMFVAESQPFFLHGVVPKSGLRAIPLTTHSTSRQLLICRHKGVSGREGDVAHYAAVNCIADTRRYPLSRTIRCAFLDRPEAKQLFYAANCSEFALECLAIGGQCMVDAYAKLKDGEEEFYPADFYARKEFEKIEMTYLRLEE